MNRKDSVNCASCGKEFELTLVAMVRRRPMWCDECIELAGEVKNDSGSDEKAPRSRETGLQWGYQPKEDTS